MLLGLVAPALAQETFFDAMPIEDTYIDQELPELNLGHDEFLVGGPKSVILVRFPRLDSLPLGQEVDTAELNLTLLEQVDVKLASASRVLVPWGEGVGIRAPMVHLVTEANMAGTATWNSARQGTAKWQTPGCAGDKDCQTSDSPLSVAVEGKTVKLTGLGPVLRAMAAAPSQNFGLKLKFATGVVFYSSDSAVGRPKLTMTTRADGRSGARLAVDSVEPDGADSWVAKVTNYGDAPATGWSATWRYRGNQVAQGSSQQAIAPGDTIRVPATLTLKADAADPRQNMLTVAVGAGGQGGTLAERTVPLNGLPMRFQLEGAAVGAVKAARGAEPEPIFLQRAVSLANDAILAKSKTSFAPSGCRERLRLTTSAEPALVVTVSSVTGVDVDQALAQAAVRAASPLSAAWTSAPDALAWPVPSVAWTQDTRDDTLWPTALMLPAFPWGAPKPIQPSLPARGLLGRAEVALLNASAGKPLADRSLATFPTPKLVIINLADGGGLPIGDADVEVFRTANGKLTTDAVYKLKTTNTGYAPLGTVDGKGPFNELKADGSNAWYLLQVTKNFVTRNAWLPATAVLAEAARGNAAPILEIRMMMPSSEIDTKTDIAEGKVVSDSLNRFPAELSALLDNKPDTTVSIEGGDKPYSVEIDLGRDRVVGAVEIETTGSLWTRFEIQAGMTGQKAGEGQLWFNEPAGSVRLADSGRKVGANTVVTFEATAVRARYLRLLVRSREKVDVAAIRVRPLAQG